MYFIHEYKITSFRVTELAGETSKFSVLGKEVLNENPSLYEKKKKKNIDTIF